MQKSSESQEQKAFIQECRWLANSMPEYGAVFKIPNEGKRSFAYAAKLKAEGLEAGVPDVFCAVMRKNFGGIFFEFKSKNGKLTEDQKKWRKKLTSQGYFVFVVNSAKEALDMLKSYLALK